MTAREAAFETLRHEDPIRFFPSWTEYLAAGPGYYALEHADIVAASRQADLFQSGAGTNIPDLPRVQRVLRLDDQHGRSSTRSTAQARVGRLHARMLQRNMEDIDAAAGRSFIVCRKPARAALRHDVRRVATRQIICDMMGIPESTRVRLI